MNGRLAHALCVISLACCAFLLSGAARADDELSMEMVGDVGVAGYYTQNMINGSQDSLSALPYLDFKFSRIFGRVDTFGIKTLKLGYGHLELVRRVRLDGFNTDTAALAGIDRRENPAPVGIGTLQVTPIGGFLLNAFRDINQSNGDIYEIIYGGLIELPGVSIYPLLGAEYLSSAYTNYFYGVSAAEAAKSRFAAYQANAALNYHLTIIADVPLSETYYQHFNFRHKWLGDAIQLSPLVKLPEQDSASVALSYHFR